MLGTLDGEEPLASLIGGASTAAPSPPWPAGGLALSSLSLQVEQSTRPLCCR